jgi:hypothetical protein
MRDALSWCESQMRFERISGKGNPRIFLYPGKNSAARTLHSGNVITGMHRDFPRGVRGERPSHQL